MKCFYPPKNLDAQCAASIIKAKYPECELIPIESNDDVERFADIKKLEKTFVVGMTPQPFVRIAKLFEYLGANLVWFDYHAEVAAVTWNKGNATMPVSNEWLRKGIGVCQTVWGYCNGDSITPDYVQMVAAYEVRDFRHPWCKPFHYGIEMEITDPMDPDNVWGKLGGDFLESVIKRGKTVQEYLEKTKGKP